MSIQTGKTIEAGTIHHLTRKAFDSGYKVLIHKGGTGSGKTYDLMIYALITFAMNTPNVIVTIVSESFPHLEIGCIRYAKKFISKLELTDYIKFNESKSFYKLPNGSIVEFFSADRIGKALGARRTLLYGNEINHLKLDVWDELARRSELVMADFNPTAQFWLEKWLEYQENYKVILSNHIDNLFLPDTERRKIEARAAKDPNFKRIHIDCEYGIYEGLVFPLIEIVDQWPEGLAKGYGLDFGYTNDPTALIATSERGDDLYLDELIYMTGLTNRDIANMFESVGIKKNYDVIIADSAEPKSIDEIRLSGYNIKPAIKGADSIKAGIDKMLQKNIKITKRSVNLIREFRNYSWVTDKLGNPTNKPIDGFNHGIDAVRYSVSLPKPKQSFVI